MSYAVIGKSVTRIDALAKVTGHARYTDDFTEQGMLVGKILRSPHAHAVIKNIDTTQARNLPGVEAVLTYEDVPHIRYATAGHPYSLDPARRDREDRYILTDKARFVGDAVAAVVARDEITAQEALKLIKVEYQVLPLVLSPEQAMLEGAPLLHDDCKNNILSARGYQIGDVDAEFPGSAYIFEGEYETSIVQHCHLENHTSYAYVEPDGRIVVVTSTQIPHIVRRIVAQALGINWGQVRIVKPYVGGGFGNKQDVCLEPLNAVLTLAVGGRPVKLELTREEGMIATQTRHAFKFKIKTGLTPDGLFTGIRISAVVNTGAYASQGHSVASSAGSKFRYLYRAKALHYDPVTVYTNLPVAGAMRGYGAPQIFYAFECHVDDIARELRIDPIELRSKNLVDVGHVDPLTQNRVLSCGIRQCISKGQELMNWDQKKEQYRDQAGELRRGLGMACFSYQSGTHPVCLEIAGARLVLNQDGSVQLQIGAAEIGQGSDTVFAQIVAEVLGLPLEMVHVLSTQDTDISPFDTGAYASRQTYITGMAVQKAALEVKQKLLDFAWGMTDIPSDLLDIKNQNIVYKHSGGVVLPLAMVARQTYYDPVFARPVTSDTSNNARINAMSYGVTFAEVEVDMLTGQIEVLEILNVHDSGQILNPGLARGQVHGGISMGIGYALAEELLFDQQSGQPLNNNLLDYKLPTSMDTPKMEVCFVESAEPSGPYGAKSLGEPPALTPAPAIRNAVLDATGLAFNSLPMSSQRVFEQFREAGLV